MSVCVCVWKRVKIKEDAAFYIPLMVKSLYLPGVRMRNPARGKGHEEGSLTYANV